MLVTLDDVARTLTADDLLICDATDRPIGLAGIMGGQNTEISDATTVVALECAWFEPAAIMRSVVRAGLRSEASARFERGVDPLGIDRRRRSFRGAAAPHLPRPRRARGRGRRRAPTVCRPSGRSSVRPGPRERPARHRVRRRGDSGPHRAHRLRLRPPRATTCSVDVPSLAARLHPGDRPRRGSRPSLRLRPARQDRAEEHPARWPQPDAAASSPTPRGVARPRYQRSHAAPVPRGRRARQGGSARRGRAPRPTRSSSVTTCCAPRCGPGLLKAIAFNESHRRSGVALFEIGHVYPPSDDVLPAEFEALAVVLAGADATEAVAVWRELAAAMGWGARLDQGNVPAGTAPGTVGDAVVGQGRDRCRRARSTPTWPTRSTSTSAWPCWS